MSEARGMPSDETVEANARDNAEQLLEQFRMLWEDAAAYADTIRDKRKLYAAGIALILGVGVLRVSWYRTTRDVSAIDSALVEFAIKALVSGALAALAAAAWNLFTERPVLRRTVVGVIARRSFRLARRAARSALLGWNRFDTLPFQRASTRLDLPSDILENLERLQPSELMLIRALSLREAYSRLVDANERVNRRIMRGVVWMGVSFGLFGIAAVWYSFALSRVTGVAHGSD